MSLNVNLSPPFFEFSSLKSAAYNWNAFNGLVGLSVSFSFDLVLFVFFDFDLDLLFEGDLFDLLIIYL